MGDTPEFGSSDDRATLDDDAKAFNKGKGRLLFAMIGFVVLAVAAFAWYLVQDQPNPYSELGRQVNGLRTQYFDAFWMCALPGKQLSTIKNDGDLRAALHERGVAGARYATHLTGKCRGNTRELLVRLRALIPPDEARSVITKMIDALNKMDEGTRGYSDYLQNLDGAYSEEAAEPIISGLARGWYEFRKASTEFNALVRAKLEH